MARTRARTSGHRDDGELSAAYRVLTDRLTWPADRAIVDRLLAGEDIPQDQRGELREAVAGEIVTDLIPESIGWMLEQGLIELVAIEPIEIAGSMTPGSIEPIAGD